MTEATMKAMKVLKITNPNWLPLIAPEIANYVKKTKITGVTYESLYTFFANVIQYGGNTSEFYVVFEVDDPVAFMQCGVNGPPSIGVVSLNHICSWTKSPEPVKMLTEECLRFMDRSRCTIMQGFAINNKLLGHYKKRAEVFNLSAKQEGIKTITFKRLPPKDIGKELYEEIKDEDIQEGKD